MKIITVGDIDKFASTVISKPSKKDKQAIESILLDVKKKGDTAVRKYEKKFGGISKNSFLVSKKEINSSYSKVTKEQIQALQISKKRLYKTESELKKRLENFVIKNDGIQLTKRFLPISSVGCYVPGGFARYPSSLIMSVIPAKVAGVRRIVVVSPSNKVGSIDPLTLVAADICGITEIYKVGGAQAVGALAYGTKSITKVDKIVGPGSMYVSIAKSLVSDTISIDMIAGPTELGIVVDSTANPDIVAADLISQAEHSEDTLCFVITCSNLNAKKIQESIQQKIKNIKRQSIVKKSLEKNGFIAVCKSDSDLIRLANTLAPEHLEIITKKPKLISSKITTAGLVLIGQNTPSSASDYMLGSNHILPTNQFGKARGSLSVLDFMKLNTEVECTKESLRKISKYMKSLCNSEELPNHYEAVRSRIK